MTWITKDNLCDFNEWECSNIDILRKVIAACKARIEELEDEIEDIELQAKDDAQRTGG